ncbi:MAG: DUF5703 domain-containing protein [Bacteroidota bacterium]|nr:DUF5703 domain-containing protein [Bacteroidota bacterium]
MTFKKFILLPFFICWSILSFAGNGSGQKYSLANNLWKSLSTYNVEWDSLGRNSSYSMPLGNGDIALNVWTERNGDILFYISKSDAWNEVDNLVKIGRVRVSLFPNPFASGASVKQILYLRNSEIQIAGLSNKSNTSLKIWVDANLPVVRIKVGSSQKMTATIAFDPWRTAPENTPGGLISADKVVTYKNVQLISYHRNESAKNPHLLNLTFGASIEGKGMAIENGNKLHSVLSANDIDFSVHVLTATTNTVDGWLSKMEKQIKATDMINPVKARLNHERWWQQFWNRSWIFVGGDSDAITVTRGYVLQRFITACAGRGVYAIKFNGSLFTVDNPSEKLGKDKTTGKDNIGPVNADFRAWGGQYWFQNTRPIYWPCLAAGDFDIMKPLFCMFSNMLPENLKQVHIFYNHEGAYFAETAPFWGGIPDIKPESKGGYTFRYFTPILELSAMMLDYYDYTGDKQFLRNTLIPIASAGLTFFDQHFPRDSQGKLLLSPDNSIEMYWDVTNPLPDIAGLHYVINRLLYLPSGMVEANLRNKWLNFLKIVPDIPMGLKNGKKVILPYACPDSVKFHNTENPELYAIYPFRIYGLEKPDYQLALETYNERLNKRSGCWYQDVIDAPLLGLADQAKNDVIYNFTRFDRLLRFPAFWDRSHDYMPDEDNGGNGQQGLQKMLMQCDGHRILLLPAWPKEWSSDFKLCAPFNTIVEASVRFGKITSMKVTPASREKDVVICSGSLKH